MFQQEHYLENFVQSTFDALPSDDLSGGARAVCSCAFTSYGQICILLSSTYSFPLLCAGCTLVVSGDGRYLTKPSVATIIRMAAANGVRKVNNPIQTILHPFSKEIKHFWPFQHRGLPGSLKQCEACANTGVGRPRRAAVHAGGVGGHPHAPRRRGIRRLHPDCQPQPGRCSPLRLLEWISAAGCPCWERRCPLPSDVCALVLAAG